MTIQEKLDYVLQYETGLIEFYGDRMEDMLITIQSRRDNLRDYDIEAIEGFYNLIIESEEKVLNASKT